MSEELSFEEWKERCASVAEDLLGLDDILAEDDPYDLFLAMEEAYENEEDPESFIREIFADELASREHDDSWEDDDDWEDDEDEDDDEDDDDEDEYDA